MYSSPSTPTWLKRRGKGARVKVRGAAVMDGLSAAKDEAVSEAEAEAATEAEEPLSCCVCAFLFVDLLPGRIASLN